MSHKGIAMTTRRKFKVGDKVRYVKHAYKNSHCVPWWRNSGCGNATKGDIATVVKIKCIPCNSIEVKRTEFGNYWYLPNSWELIRDLKIKVKRVEI